MQSNNTIAATKNAQAMEAHHHKELDALLSVSRSTRAGISDFAITLKATRDKEDADNLKSTNHAIQQMSYIQTIEKRALFDSLKSEIDELVLEKLDKQLYSFLVLFRQYYKYARVQYEDNKTDDCLRIKAEWALSNLTDVQTEFDIVESELTIS
jgi:hypothetical protein